MRTRILWVSFLVLILSALGYCSYPGDSNGDRVCDDLDFLEVINNFGKNYLPINGPGDCYQDGVVDDLDFLSVTNNFGKDYRYIVPGEMVYIPAGDFLMGNSGVGDDAVYRSSYPEELPQHWVNLSAYWIGKYEVTRGEYRQFINAGGYSSSVYWSSAGWNWKVANNRTEPGDWAASAYWVIPPGAFTQSEYYPVIDVNYYEAEAYCNWAGGHLPTEAQWEKAARWNPTTNHPNVYPWGDVNYRNKCNDWYDDLYPGHQTSPIGSYPLGVSPYGCQDMAGNVFEWCKDWYSATYYAASPASDPQGPTCGTYGVLRGGAWSDGEDYSRTAHRYTGDLPKNYWTAGGFRLARD